MGFFTSLSKSPVGAGRDAHGLRQAPNCPMASGAHRVGADAELAPDRFGVELVAIGHLEEPPLVGFEGFERVAEPRAMFGRDELAENVVVVARSPWTETLQRSFLAVGRTEPPKAQVEGGLKKIPGKSVRVLETAGAERFESTRQRFLGDVLGGSPVAEPPRRENLQRLAELSELLSCDI